MGFLVCVSGGGGEYTQRWKNHHCKYVVWPYWRDGSCYSGWQQKFFVIKKNRCVLVLLWIDRASPSLTLPCELTPRKKKPPLNQVTLSRSGAFELSVYVVDLVLKCVVDKKKINFFFFFGLPTIRCLSPSHSKHLSKCFVGRSRLHSSSQSRALYRSIWSYSHRRVLYMALSIIGIYR